MTKNLTKNQLLILQTFHDFPIHPTAEQLFELVHTKNPKMGLSTMYRLLGRLVQDGKIQKISGLETKDHYDHTLTQHPHFICKCCGTVSDIPEGLYSVSVEKIEKQMGICCHSFQMNIHGVCSNCTNKRSI